MRRATVTTSHDDAATAARIAAAVRPDNTPEMDTRVEDDSVVTTVARETTGGLQSTVDDFVVNCTVADRLMRERTDDANDAERDDADGRSADADTADADSADADQANADRADPDTNTQP